MPGWGNDTRIGCFALFISAALLTGCTRAELESKADAYNNAIAESNNRQILLNAVRASQRAPMSFVGFGDVAASPNWSASTAGTFNFDPFGLTSYNINPSVAVAGGFSSFTMNNLNNSDFARQLQQHIDPRVVRYFDDLKFPKELIQLIFVQEYDVSAPRYYRIMADVRTKCENVSEPRTQQFCEQLARDRAEFEAAGCADFPVRGGMITVLNTARDRCSMIPFLIFERQLRLLDVRLPFKTKTAQAILYYLGELIAAQNYSVHPFMPEVLVDASDGRRITVPLFEVRRGLPLPGQAAVFISYNGDSFYIPKPEFGTLGEARSLQVLDLVSQILTAATSKEALPKTSTVTLVQAR